VRQEEFSVQARRFDAFFAEEIRAFLNGFKNGHAPNLKQNRPR
jgi:hypothetical protein